MPMPHANRLALLGFVLCLAGCQSLTSSRPPAPQHIAWEHLKPGCSGSDCPLVNIDTLRFADEPGLNGLIERRLLDMTRNAPDAPLPRSLQDYERDFLRDAEPRWSSYLQAKVREQRDQILLIELSSYLDTGGAHGMPGRGFITYDRNHHLALTLQDMLLPGQETAFWRVVEQAHGRWLTANKLDADYLRDWPFQRTPHVGLGRGAVLVKYDVYTIAPYSSGHPELEIPYPQLNGILRPEYFPGRG
ncbi:RsiV family protein [Pseudomonas sp. RIT-PI-AD]|uniref:RsiV family protein n=1 Tax=Pseudomonas sp. RIT-PI-AD TaxID=3035294 RepID=UPI0021DA67B5|nr:RsiV family protein [Pseudomonas sp. RIT-PI-AD]